MTSKQLWLWLAKKFDRAAVYCRGRVYSISRRDDLTRRGGWHSSHEDGLLDQYVSECVRFATGQKCNEPFLREIESAGNEPITEGQAADFRRAVLVEVECSRHIPLGQFGAIGWSRHVPRLVHMIEAHVNPNYPKIGKTVEQKTKARYAAEVVNYCTDKPSDEAFMRGVEESGAYPVPEQGADAFRQKLFSGIIAGAFNVYDPSKWFKDPEVVAHVRAMFNIPAPEEVAV